MLKNNQMFLVIRKMQVKTTLRFHPMLDRMFKINKIIDSKEYWRDVGEGNTHTLLLGLETDVVFFFPYSVCAKDKLFCRNHSCLLDHIDIVDIPSQVSLLLVNLYPFP